MTNKFSTRSQSKLDTCCPEIQEIAEHILVVMDISVIWGHRTKIDQDHMFLSTPKRSKLRWPDSKHNKYPSQAVDLAPYPMNWSDTSHKNIARFYAMIGIAEGVARELGYDIRTGADWDGDWDFTDQSFDDLAHIEFRGHVNE